MRIGAAPPASPVTSPASVVTRSGQARQVSSVSVERELPSSLPASVTAGGGITAATGHVEWAPEEVVRDRDVSPWRSGQVPQPGEPVTVDMDAGAGAHRVFTGAVDNTTGVSGRPASSSLIDPTWRLHQQVTVEPLLRLMPPHAEGGDYRRIGLMPVFVVDRAMRAAGYHTTPPAEYDSAVSVPLQGSVWPEHGTCTAAGSQPGSTNSHASFWRVDGRMYASDALVTYAPRVSRPATTAVCLSLSVASTGHAGAGILRANYGSASIELRVLSSGNAVGMYNGTTVVGPLDARGRRVSLLVKDGTWTLRTSTGETATGTQAVTSTAMSSATLSLADEARVAGAMISHPRNTAEEHQNLAHIPNARVRPGFTAHGMLDASPSIVNRRALDVLREIADALCSPMWFDEDGVLQWAGPDALRAQAPAVTVVAKDSLLSLAWRVSLDHVRSTTAITWDKPEVTVRRWPTVTWWEGSRDTLNPGDETRQLIDAPTDQDWISPALPALYAGSPTGDAFNRGISSWVGGYIMDTTGERAGWFTPAHGTATLTRITHDTYLHVKTINSSLPTPATMVATEVDPGSAGLWPKWAGQTLPILRGYARTDWHSTTTDSASTGPAGTPALIHDAGPWVQHAGTIGAGDVDMPARLADWIADQVTTPVPEVTGLRVAPDPRIQLGDVIALADPDNLAVALTGLVTGVALDHDPPGMSMSLSLQVISADPTHTSYDQLQALWAGADYAALEAAWAGADYYALEANPTEETP